MSVKQVRLLFIGLCFALLGLAILLPYQTDEGSAARINQRTLQHETLNEAWAAGRIAIQSAQGHGYSSGLSLSGRLENLTSQPLRLSSHLAEPLVFRNRGRGQDMLVTRVFLQDGEYFEDGEGPYIPLEPHGTGHSNTLVSYMAYCIDFEKDNPSASETLYVERITEELLPIAVQIATYEKMYPDVDTTIGAQLALWRSQGLELGEIASIFDYSNIDVSHMNDILALAVD